MEGNKISEKDLLLIEEKVKTFFFLTRQYVEPSVSSNELGKKAIRLISESRYKASNKIHRKVWLYFVKQKIVLSAAMLFGVFIAGFGYYILKNMNISSNDCYYYKFDSVKYSAGKREFNLIVVQKNLDPPTSTENTLIVKIS